MHVGNKIKELVKAKRIKVDELAELLKKHPKYIYYIYKQPHINTELLEEIAKILKVNIKYFFEETDGLDMAYEPESSYKVKDLKDKLIESQEREIGYLREELEKLKSCCTEQKTKTG